ncbi:MAG: helix-turn-helix transcriptional regulator [Planctomycetota bacterium]
MLLWSTDVSVLRPLPGFARVRSVAAERQHRPTYHHVGKRRIHEDHCLFKLTLAGEGVFRDASGEHRLPAGHGFLCIINDPATAYYYPSDGCVDWEFVYIAFGDGNARAMTAAVVERHGPVFALPLDHGFAPSLLDWRRERQGHVTQGPAASARVVASLFAALLTAAGGEDGGEPGQQLVRTAIEVMDRQLDTGINVSEVARHLGVSREHLSRAFRTQMDQTPYNYLQRRRMIEACRLLKDTELGAAQVARRLGYADPGHFARTFKRTMGLTPTRFRAVGAIPLL